MSWPEPKVRDPIKEMAGDELEDRKYFLQNFELYETRSNYYMVGRDKNETLWRVLTIDRLEPSELKIWEDSTTYTESECSELLKRIHEGNRSTGGLKFVRSCYGIVGFVKFLGPYYMLLITERKEIGSICGHMVYAVTKSEMIALLNPIIQSNIAVSKDENRYKKLLCMVDLTKDFFFSYSYHVMRSLQKNLCDHQAGQVLYETMFVWNEFLTRGIRNHVKNTLWTVALVYGFFEQAKLSISGKDFHLTLIARRSRHYAGTRYLKRGVNEKGRVANDVETEQIVFEEKPGGIPTQISSVVQNRGSIPLFWSQETSRLHLKPDIVLHRKDKNYEATRLHFENLVNRYGNPIIILNLIKTCEKKPRESILHAEFANAINMINKDLSEEHRLRFLHWDLSTHSQSKTTKALSTLGKVTEYALNLTGFFYCQVTPTLSLDGALKWPVVPKGDADELAHNIHFHDNSNNNGAVKRDELAHNNSNDVAVNAESGSQGDNAANSISSASGSENNEIFLEKPSKFQKGVLRTNCIDCLDRTNVAQYAYGLAALGHQLHVLGFISFPKIDIDAPLGDELMSFYETMGDTLALQYGGSAAHNKGCSAGNLLRLLSFIIEELFGKDYGPDVILIFSERRGQRKAAIQSQEFFRTLQRYYNNAYMDAEKQNAINLFLGYFQPQENKPALWELDSDQHHSANRWFIKRSLSDGNILQKTNNTPVISCNRHKRLPNSAMSSGTHQVGEAHDLSNSTPEDSVCGCDMSYSRYSPTMPGRKLFVESAHSYFTQHGFDEPTSSNFLDPEWLLSFGNSCEEESFESSTVTNTPVENLSTENVINGLNVDTSPPLSENGSGIKGKATMEMQSSSSNSDAVQSSDNLGEFSESFVHWVISGETICD